MSEEINQATTTTTQSPNLKGNIQSSTTISPITKTMSTETAVGSSSFGVKTSTITLPNVNVEVTTFSALNVEHMDRPESKLSSNDHAESLTIKPEPQEFTPPAETEPSIAVPITSAVFDASSVTQSSVGEVNNEFTPPSETEPPLAVENKNISAQAFDNDEGPETKLEPALLPQIELFPRIDMGFYNDSTRSEERLAFCLNSLECDPEDNQVDCVQLNLFCNQGLNVTGINPKIILKLSECMIQDIICFLQGDSLYEYCRNRFVSCADIIMPSFVRIPLADNSLETNLSGLDGFVEITGISEISNQSSTIAGNVSNNVLESISQTLGEIELSELGANLTLDDIIADNTTLKIYQDIHIILNDDPTQSNGTIVELTINGTTLQVDIDNPSIVLDPNSFIIGLENQTNIDNPTKEMLIEKVLQNFGAVGTVCALCGKANHSLSVDLDVPYLVESYTHVNRPKSIVLERITLRFIRPLRGKPSLNVSLKTFCAK
ncbi:hypothetical protein TCAL_15965 [Tigriopus californicus]|uniref:Uncharacterized protein n=1 Tax=Tigriopus californicus TaxID=6832 RepID=A0A553PFI7_TIGCA|nr:hypothetical protein TCAL_15965 [Tigriopus californicus]